jgi:hypothetical protein
MSALGLWASLSWAGPTSSGGGFAVVCRNAQHTIVSAELLDLYEAQERYGLRIVSSSGDLVRDYVRGVRNTYRLQGSKDPVSIDEQRKYLSKMFEILDFTAPGEHLVPLADMGHVPSVPEGCDLEQLAIFHDDRGRISVDSEIWEALDTLSRAALFSHELYYKDVREWGEKTSEGARALVGQIYSKSGELTPIFNGIPRGTPSCFTAEFSVVTAPNNTASPQQKLSLFYPYRVNRGGAVGSGVMLQFFSLMGRPMLSKTTAYFPGVRLSYERGGRVRLVNSTRSDFVLKVPVVGSYRKDWELELRDTKTGGSELGLYEAGVLVEESPIVSCTR